MRALTGELLLRAWDQGLNQHPVHQGFVMLALALPEDSLEQIADLSLAENNLLLLQLHAISFGSTLEAFATCSTCGAHLEVHLPVEELIDHQHAATRSGPEEWTENGRLFCLRPLTSNDLLASLDAATSAEAEHLTLKRCIRVLPQLDGSFVEMEEDQEEPPIPSPAFLMERFERVNQAAELSCTVECVECSSRSTLDLNLAQFLFRLVERGAKRLLREIHDMAWAYGWSEEAILRMSAKRRSAYLEMLSA